MSYTLNVVAYNKATWINFIEHNRYYNLINKEITELHVDFSRCGFIKPYHIVSLGCLIEEYYQAGVKISFAKCHNPYLSNIRLFDYWTKGFNRNNYTSCNINTALGLWKINHAMITQYVMQAQQYFESNFFKGKDVEPLNICLSELFNNINDHSHSDISGYCLNQYYPNIDKIRMSVCDFGKGIPETVNDYLLSIGSNKLSDKMALEKAFELKFSSKSQPHNQGRGLDTLKEIINDCDGILRVYSNNSCLIIRDGSIKSFKLEYPFHGTLFDIELNTTKFDSISDDYEDLLF